MRWFWAGAGFGLQVAALIIFLASLRWPALQRGKVRRTGLAIWSAGAAGVAGFAVYDHDVTLFLGQMLAWLIYAILVFKTGR